MEELLALQAELARVQSAPSSFKLSEPNVVEVVHKLIELGLVDVLFTTNGKEYLTRRQLRNEVEDEIAAHGGRVNVTELVSVLNVDLPHIERVVHELLQSDAPCSHVGKLQLFQGDLIADMYLENLAEEINQDLKGTGKLTIGDLAVQHTLTSEFITRLVESRLGSTIEAKLSGGSLFTAAYVTRHSARVRGVLSALIKPASIPQLIREHGLSEGLFHDCLAELVSSGRLNGTLSGKSTFTPAIYEHAQATSVMSFYKQNGMIEYGALAKIQVKDPKAHLRAQFPDGVALNSCFIKRELLEAVVAQVDEACTTAGAIDLYGCFTFSLNQDDLNCLVAASPQLSTLISTGQAIRLGEEGSILVSAALLELCSKPLGELAHELAKTKFNAGATASSKGDDDDASGGRKKGKAKGASAAKGKKGKRDDDDDDDDDGGRRGGKKGKDWRDAALGGDLEDDDNDDDEAPRGKKGKQKPKDKKKPSTMDSVAPAEDRREGIDCSRLEEALLKAVPSLDETEDLAQVVAAHLLPKLTQLTEKRVEEMRSAGVTERRKAVQMAQEKLALLSINLQMFIKAIEAAELEPAAESALDESLLKSTCTELFVALLRSEALHAGMQLPNLLDPEGSLSANERKDLLAALPAKQRAALQALEKSLTGKSASANGFIEAVWVAEETLGEQCMRLDKKREKTALANARASLRSQLETVKDLEAALHLSVLLLEIELNGLFFQVPGNRLHVLIDHLQSKISASTHTALGKCHAAVIKSQACK